MSENGKSLFSTLQASGSIFAAVVSEPLWSKATFFALAFLFGMCALRQLLLAYRDGSIVASPVAGTGEKEK